jgi:hypothetical protein
MNTEKIESEVRPTQSADRIEQPEPGEIDATDLEKISGGRYVEKPS